MAYLDEMRWSGHRDGGRGHDGLRRGGPGGALRERVEGGQGDGLEASGERGADVMLAVADAAPSAQQLSLLSWLESQCSVTRVWLDRLIAEGDPDDLVSVLHRQAVWLDLVRERLGRA